MPQSLSQVILHIVFSTKGRRPWLDPAIRPRMHAYLDDLVRYVDNQETHHKTKTFQEEYRELLQKYNIPFDERYVWD